LTVKLEKETLTDAERAELLALAEASERVSLFMVESAGELARRYHISPEEALATLKQEGQQRG
jgi:hypothetical protein